MDKKLIDLVVFDPTNAEQKCPCVISLDISESMTGNPIYELNEGIKVYQQAIQKDELAMRRVEQAIITFGGEVKVAHPLTDAAEFRAPHFSAAGMTPMGEAIEKGLDLLDERRKIARHTGVSLYRPWLFLVSDGAPTDFMENAIQRLRDWEKDKKVVVFAVGVQGADMNMLARLSARPPMKLKGLRFNELFEWLSVSLGSVARSQPGEDVGLQEPLVWAA
jgi:uncharacterized protein YegL